MTNNRIEISPILVGYSEILAIVGDIVRVKVPEEENGNGMTSCLEDLAVLEAVDGSLSLAQVIGIKRDIVALQVFNGTQGISTDSTVRFLGHPMQATYSGNIFGRVFRGTGEPIDGGPDLSNDPKVTIGGPSVNPMRRILASKMIRTDVPMIDVFNCLVESQKIPIFSVSGEPFNQLLARIGIQADADVIVFGGMGLIFDDYHFFRKAFEEAGIFTRTVMFVNQASDPVVERLLIPDLALAVAENIAVDERKRVLVLLSDMTAFADALKEVSIAMDQVPANRGYPGREDHNQIMNTMIRFYSQAKDAQQKQAMAFELSAFDQKLLKFGVAPDWVERVLAMLELLRRGNDVAQMMQVTGEEGVSLEDHLVHEKSLFLDMVYLQQDAFDQVDASAPLPRQKRTFDLVFDLLNRPYQFKDKSAIRDYFVRLTGLFKNLNYSQEESSQYKEFLSKIQELADSTVKQNVKF